MTDMFKGDDAGLKPCRKCGHTDIFAHAGDPWFSCAVCMTFHEGEPTPWNRRPTDDASLVKPADVESVLQWLDSLPTLDMDDIAADGGVTVAMVVQQEAAEMAGRLKRYLAACGAGGWRPDREAVARIIEPWPFGIVANIQHTERAADDRAKAYTKADQILALAPAPSQGEG